MGTTSRILGTSAVVGFLLPRYVPDYTLGTVITSVLCLIVSIVLYAAYQLLIYPRFVSPLRHLPAPPHAHWLLGHTKRILAEPTGIPMREWLEKVPNNGLIRYSLWFQERVLVTTPQALGDVLVGKAYDFIKPSTLRNSLGRILGIGILLAEGDEHRQQRRNLLPAFAFRHVKDIYPIFWNKSQEMVRCIAADLESGDSTSKEPEAATSEVEHEKGAIDVGNWTSRATLDIIGLSGMGRDFNSLQDPNNKLSKTYKSIFSIGRPSRLLQIAALLTPFWIIERLPMQRNQDLKIASSYIKQVCRDLVAQKRKAIESEKGRVEVDILSVAMESGGFQDEDLVNQMMTFLVAGHETTATAMIWAIYVLSKNPEIQTKLREAVRAKIPSLDSDITASDIDDCHYLQAVCSEVLRLWAPVPMTLRVAGKDTSINNVFVPKGTTVIISPWAINHNTGLWGADALEFNPERWLNADGKANAKGSADSNYSFLTFLHGPRSCIGQKFAVSEFACLLAAWVGRFDTRLEHGSVLASDKMPDISGGVTSKPRGGLWCKVEEVPGW